jgi:arylsulfatase A-like enzyme
MPGLMGSSLFADNISRKKPNVIVVCVDQLRSFALGCYGNNFVQTPNIDSLAQNGCLFEHGITNAPTCVAARSCIMSGQHARTCVGSRVNEMESHLFGRSDRRKFKDSTLPEEFKKLGYKTLQIGKWHIDTKPSLLGFDESLVTAGIYTKGGFHKNEGPRFGVPGFTPDYEIRKVKETIRENKDNPFFLYYNIVQPHMPIADIPYKYSHMYDAKDVPLRDNVWKDGKLPYDEKWFYIYLWQQQYEKGNYPITARVPDYFNLRHLAALYYGCVTWVDDLVGEMVKSLEKNNMLEDTIIVFTADHGDNLGSHHLWNKNRLYEESSRVPFIVSWPGSIKNRVNNSQTASLIDIMPTLVDLSGGKIPSSVHGQSLAPVLQGRTDSLEKNYAFIETAFGKLGVRTPTHTYGVSLDKNDHGIENDKYLFIDRTQDPYQMNNLVETSEQSDLAKSLRNKVIEWDKENVQYLSHFQN